MGGGGGRAGAGFCMSSSLGFSRVMKGVFGGARTQPCWGEMVAQPFWTPSGQFQGVLPARLGLRGEARGPWRRPRLSLPAGFYSAKGFTVSRVPGQLGRARWGLCNHFFALSKSVPKHATRAETVLFPEHLTAVHAFKAYISGIWSHFFQPTRARALESTAPKRITTPKATPCTSIQALRLFCSA